MKKIDLENIFYYSPPGEADWMYLNVFVGNSCIKLSKS